MRALVFTAIALAAVSISYANFKLQEVNLAKTAIVKCHSNDADHNFLFWSNPKQLVIGPGNDFDKLKYDYEILTGTLIIKSVTIEDEGNYECVSRGIRNGNINIKTVKLLVQHETQQGNSNDESNMHFFAVILGVGALIICAASAFLIYKKLSNRKLNQLNFSDPSDEDSGEDIYSKAGPSTSEDFPPIKKETMKSAFVNQAMSTDLKNILINTDE